MYYKKLLAGALAFSLAACAYSCGSKDSSSSGDTSSADTTAAPETEAPETAASAPEATTEAPATEPETVEVTEAELPPPPVPNEATDPNTVTFDDGDFSFAAPKTVDADCAIGTLEIADVQGNKMLKFVDDLSVPLDGKVQKVEIHPAPLIGQENLGKVRRIEFDIYADALAPNYKNEDGELTQVPGTICGGGGTVTAALDSNGEGKWYDFAGFEGGEYNYDFSGAVHGEFKFLLAGAGQCWDETMEDANFLIMRWGSENDSNFYIDNIVFYDEDGNSIPLVK